LVAKIFIKLNNQKVGVILSQKSGRKSDNKYLFGETT